MFYLRFTFRKLTTDADAVKKKKKKQQKFAAVNRSFQDGLITRTVNNPDGGKPAPFLAAGRRAMLFTCNWKWRLR